MGDRLEPLLTYHPFTRLNALLADLRTPQGVQVLNLGAGRMLRSGSTRPGGRR